VDWRDVASKRIEESPRTAQLSNEQKERQIEMSAKFPYFRLWLWTPGPILLAVIVGAAMLGAYNLLGGAGANFSVSMGIVSHAYLVTMVSSLLFLLILFLKPPARFNWKIRSPQTSARFYQTHLEDRHGFGRGHRPLQLLDIFSDWIGFAAYNPKN